MNNTSLSALTAAFKALGDPTRLRILGVLAGVELRVSEIVEVLQMGQSRVSRHLRILVEVEMLRSRSSGVWTFYSIRQGGPYAPIIREALSSLPENREDLARREMVLTSRREETRRFFDTRAGQWESMKRRIFGKTDPDSIVCELIGSDAKSVADLGCGEGRLVELMARRVGVAGRVIGVDNAPAMIEYARTRLAHLDNVEFRLGDIEHLPFRDAEVRVAVLSLVLHHLLRPTESIAEAVRVVAPGGVIIVAEFAVHANEALRDAHGDRWLGIEMDAIEARLTGEGCRIAHKSDCRLREGMTLCCVAAQKSTIQS